MTSSRRWIWIVGAIAGLIVIGTWMGYRWVTRALAGLGEDTRSSFQAGAALGSSLTASACLDTAFARHPSHAKASVVGQFGEVFFVEGCLRTSTPSPALCVDVPAPESVKGLLRFSAWSIEECQRRRLRDPNCSRLLQPLLGYCQRLREKTPGVK